MNHTTRDNLLWTARQVIEMLVWRVVYSNHAPAVKKRARKLLDNPNRSAGALVRACGGVRACGEVVERAGDEGLAARVEEKFMERVGAGSAPPPSSN